MFIKKTPKTPSTLEVQIESALLELDHHSATSAEYAKIVEQLEKLAKIRPDEKGKKISADTMLTVIANLAGIGMILGYEKANVITSKALGFVLKSRL